MSSRVIDVMSCHVMSSHSALSFDTEVSPSAARDAAILHAATHLLQQHRPPTDVQHAPAHARSDTGAHAHTHAQAQAQTQHQAHAPPVPHPYAR